MKSQKQIFDELNKNWEDAKEKNRQLKSIMLFNPPFEEILKEYRRISSFHLAEIYKDIAALRKRIEGINNE
jgi:hypothetical protein